MNTEGIGRSTTAFVPGPPMSEQRQAEWHHGGDLHGLAGVLMVSRDTGELDAASVSRGAIESVAENLVDGAIAPLFFAGLFGPVGIVVFKAVSTMDSMIGKRDERYRQFGTCAARLDDLLNYVPARLGYVLIVLAAPLVRLNGGSALRIGWRDRRKHDSPNSAWSEAAFAGALEVTLGGVDQYAGQPRPHPLLG